MCFKFCHLNVHSACVQEQTGGGRREEGEMGVSEGFMGVIMESQWLAHWHWDIFSHPPPIIRWMEQEGVSTATYGRRRMACCRVGAQITYSGCLFAFLSSRQPYTSSYIKWFLDSISHNLMPSKESGILLFTDLFVSICKPGGMSKVSVYNHESTYVTALSDTTWYELHVLLGSVHLTRCLGSHRWQSKI